MHKKYLIMKNYNFWTLREKLLNETNPLKIKFYKKKYRKMLKENNAWIPLSADIKEVPLMPHGIKGVFISKNATIGKGCTILHQVTIGSNAFDDSKHTGSPVIGDNVFIGAGAKIIGGIKIGNNVRIGAGCVVCEDIPDNCTVVLPKPVIIEHTEKRNNKYKLL
ncbi:serine acetyltransferase [uncultured Eubacterium sp.]|uniref:serine acetyltransferase n=1 Tax=uncultured Eubacterium sp. TaxID=165185 RepID=UPI0025857CC6|nr:serine acetyltransferase [uncultured Eubacterium sp.]